MIVNFHNKKFTSLKPLRGRYPSCRQRLRPLLKLMGTIILGAGSGVLGSTVNPFLVSTSIGALKGVGI